MRDPEACPAYPERRTYIDRFSGFAQQLIDKPDQTERIIDELKDALPTWSSPTPVSLRRHEIDQKVIPGVILGALGHLTAMKILARSMDPTSDIGQRQETPILDRGISPRLRALRRRPYYPPPEGREGDWPAFVGIFMDTAEPSLEAVLQEVAQDGKYAPLWFAFDREQKESFAISVKAFPEDLSYGLEQELDNSLSAVHSMYWEVARGLLTSLDRWPHHANLTPDELTSMGSFQQATLRRGAIRFWAQAAKMPTSVRDTCMSDSGSDRRINDEFYVEASDVVLRWGGKLGRAVESGASKCSGVYLLSSPNEQVRKLCEAYTMAVGLHNRMGASTASTPLSRAVSGAEVLAFTLLHIAPSTLWGDFMRKVGMLL